MEIASAGPIGLSSARIAEVTAHLPHWSRGESSRPDDAASEADGAEENIAHGMDEEVARAEGDSGAAGADGSNPLAAVSKLDLIWQYKNTTNRKHSSDFHAEGATMLHPKLKLNVELHYWDTNVTGESENDWERFTVKPIYFPKDVNLSETWGMRIAVGLEYIYDFDNEDEGIGTGTDQLAPLVGFAFMNKETKTALIPLVQHFEDIGSGPSISTTVLRLIALQPFPDGYWGKADVKLPYDWEEYEWPVEGELELGKMFTPNFGVFVQGLIGIGGNRPYTYGAGLGLRINF